MDAGQEGSLLTMSRKGIGWIVAALAGALLIYAWIDGGAEPLHPIVEPVPLPETAR